MAATLIVLVVVVLVAAAVVDLRARRQGHRVRGGGEIATEVRQQRLHTRARRGVAYRRTGDLGVDDTYPTDRERRLGS